MLDPALSTAETRRLWAIRKSKAIARRRMDLDSGASRVDSQLLTEAVQAYFTAKAHELRPRTIQTYRAAVDPFVEWMVRNGAKMTQDLNKPRLLAWRAYVVSKPGRAASKGGKRGERHETAPRRATSVNKDLRAVKTILNHMREGGQLNLNGDDIRDVLKKLKEPRLKPKFLQSVQLRALLAAAHVHDDAVFKTTRVERGGLRPIGSTPKHIPILPFLTFLMLSGCRRGEALGLLWSDVDLEALDGRQEVVGQFDVRADISKTRHERTVFLEVSPALRTLLARRQLQGVAQERVFGEYSVDSVEAARERLITLGAPPFSWQLLRSTVSTYLVNSPAVFGNAGVFLASKMLGHSVDVMEKHYAGLLRGLPREARTLESAMQIEDEIASVLTTLIPNVQTLKRIGPSRPQRSKSDAARPPT